ncbi:Ig-like domain-containing protein [Bifidobacterium sp. ESL0704]|uniref:Ig-like domain-containing protein n=1 Tax=Bifidobacterium sp. ESL0704 TaxID=2983219 RepID=UPI0023FA1031|nr:Ig-like domain-containing protein [Bifidobacterium sp. ESL0704]WEV53180.1 Ig-like domain-containing protein [Bifidobacterium sp. ESL0704]
MYMITRHNTKPWLARIMAISVAVATLLTGTAIAQTANAGPRPQADENVAANAASGNGNAPDVVASYSTGWQGGPNALNDGSPDASDYKGWGTWGNVSPSENATYTWKRPVTISSSKIWYYNNVVGGDGGVLLPSNVKIEYLNSSTGDFEEISNLVTDQDFPETPTKSNYGPFTYTFDEVTTKALRLTVMKRANDNRGITLGEWQVFGTSQEEPVDPGAPDEFLWTQEIYLRTTIGVNPTSQLPTHIWATPENGPTVKLPVTWNSIPAEDYGTAGTTKTVHGTTTAGTYGGKTIPATAVEASLSTFATLDTTITDVEYVSTLTTAGIAPVFPNTVYVQYADGSKQSGVAVTWDTSALTAADYDAVDDMGTVDGTVAGTSIQSSATFIVVEPSPTDAPPVVSLDFDQDALGATGWYTSKPMFTLTAQRGVSNVPITALDYRIDNGAWQTYHGATAIDLQGSVTVEGRATDANNKTQTQKQSIKIDTQAPTTTITKKTLANNGKDMTIALQSSDGDKGSGVTRVLYSTGPSSNPKSNENTMWGTYTDNDKIHVQLASNADTYVHYYAQDAAGHAEAYKSENLGKAQTPTVVSATGITISAPGAVDGKLAMKRGGAMQLTATVTPEDATDKSVTWSSSDNSVVSIDANGKATALKAGKATITAKANNNPNTSIAVQGEDEVLAQLEITVSNTQKDVLESAVANAEKLKQSSYTPDSWAAVSEALTKAKQVLSNNNSTEEEATAALNGLQTAVKNLVPVSSGTNPNQPNRPNQPVRPNQPNLPGQPGLSNKPHRSQKQQNTDGHKQLSATGSTVLSLELLTLTLFVLGTAITFARKHA